MRPCSGDFSLLDAIERRIVELPRVPSTGNAMAERMPTFRDLREHIRNDMPRWGAVFDAAAKADAVADIA